MAPDYFLREAAAEFPATKDNPHGERGLFTTLRHIRIPEDRADEWVDRLDKLALEFAGQQRGGETTYGMLLAIYPTTKPRLGDEE